MRSRRIGRAVVLALGSVLGLVAARSGAQPCLPGWVAGEGVKGVDGPVYASITHDDGSGPSLFVAGGFEAAGREPARHMARWDGQEWHAVGDGLEESYIPALAVRDGHLFAGVGAPTAGPDSALFEWDGHDWTAVPMGAGSYVTALTVFNGDLVAAGKIIAPGGQVMGVGAWNGSTWSVVGTNPIIATPRTYALHVHDGKLYVGGQIYLTNPNRVVPIACLDGNTWTLPGSGLSGGEVRALASFQGELVAAGACSRAGQAVVNCIARWDGYNWLPLGDGLGEGSPNDGAFEMVEHEGQLFVCGQFYLYEPLCDGTVPAAIARWDGSCWQSAGEGPLWRAHSIASFGGRLFVAGEFGSDWGYAAWDGSSWSIPGQGSDGPVTAAIVHDGALVVGGYFNDIGAVHAPLMAVQRNGAWEPMGAGWHVPAHAFANYRGRLIAGGAWWYQEFQSGGGGGSIGAWDGAAWEPLHNGLLYTPAVDALLVAGDDLIAAGHFSFDVQESAVARWDGGLWHPMGADGRALVTSLALYNGDIIAAGRFDTGMTGGRVMKWDGAAWVQLGDLPPGFPTALAVYRGELYTAGPTFVARLDGAVWTKLPGVSPVSKCLLGVNNGVLYAASSRVVLEWPTVGEIVRFDGAAWSVVADGLNFRNVSQDPITEKVGALAFHGPDLLIGGDFTRAHDTVSAYFARLSPSSHADMNLDGFVDGVDADLFGNAFESGGAGADINHDGFIDGVDYDMFHNAFEVGC